MALGDTGHLFQWVEDPGGGLMVDQVHAVMRRVRNKLFHLIHRHWRGPVELLNRMRDLKHLGDLGGSFAVDSIGEDQHTAAHVPEGGDGGFDPGGTGTTQHRASISIRNTANLQQLRSGFLEQVSELALPVSYVGVGQGGAYTLRDIRRPWGKNYHLRKPPGNSLSLDGTKHVGPGLATFRIAAEPVTPTLTPGPRPCFDLIRHR